MTRVLWITPRPLYPARAGGEIRTSGLIDAAVKAGHDVLVIEAGTSPGKPPGGVELCSVTLRSGITNILAKATTPAPLRAPRPNRAALIPARAQIAAFSPHCVVVSEIYSASLVDDLLPPESPWIYDAHNVEVDRYRALAAAAGSLSEKLSLRADISRVARAERDLVGRATATTCVSPSDAERFVALTGSRRPVVVPSSVPTPITGVMPSRGTSVGFVGTLNYPPNVEAVEALVDEVMPAVRRAVPHAALLVAGRSPGRHLRALLGSRPWIDFREDLADLRPVYEESRCVVLPITAGGGSRLKVYEALSHGVPVVATEQAVAGVSLSPTAALLGGSNADLAGHAVDLLLDPELANQVGSSGRAHFIHELSWQHAAAPMLDLLDSLVGAP